MLFCACVPRNLNLKHIYSANFPPNIATLDLLSAIYARNLETIFPNICISLRIFCTVPVSVASAERSFSVLARVKNFQALPPCPLNPNWLGNSILIF